MAGTRQLVLYLAEHKQAPSIPKSRKNGWEAADRFFFGFLDTARYTKIAVPDADGWKGSKSYHEYVGRCADRRRAEEEAPLKARALSCVDDECLRGRFDKCVLVKQVGRMRNVETPLATGSRMREGALLQLHEFAELLEKGMVVAVNAGDDERDLEGDYWLALLLGGAFECPGNLVHATDTFEAGWLVVRVRWYSLKQISQRAYVLLPDERLVPVNALVRLLGLDFTNSFAASRETRQSKKKGGPLQFFSEDAHNSVLAACRHEVHQGPAIP